MTKHETAEAPQNGYYLLNTDGGMVTNGRQARKDPAGEAAIAVVLKRIVNRKERLVEGFSGPIGPATGAVAEYKALIEGLVFALGLGITQIRVYVDTEFLVEQMNSVSADRSNYYSTSKVRQAELVPLYAEARRLADQFSSIRISWVPRERNQDADALATAALPSSSPN